MLLGLWNKIHYYQFQYPSSVYILIDPPNPMLKFTHMQTKLQPKSAKSASTSPPPVSHKKLHFTLLLIRIEKSSTPKSSVAAKCSMKFFTQDLATCNSMLNAYCINGEILSALELFRKIPNKDIISWTSVINGLVKNGQCNEAIDLFRKLVLRPNEATLVSALSACANMDSVSQGKEIHAYIVRHENQIFTAFLVIALIDFYGKHGCLDSSNIVFRLCERKDNRTWNASISAFACNGREVEALQLFDEMPLRPNHITFIALLTAFSQANFVDLGLSLFDLMCNKYGIVPTMEHYGCVVDVLRHAGRLREAWEFIERMPIEPDSSVLGAILGACRIHGDVELGAIVGRELWHCGRYMVLWNIFAECEKWDEAQELKVKMGKAGVKKIAGSSWLGSS